LAGKPPNHRFHGPLGRPRGGVTPIETFDLVGTVHLRDDGGATLIKVSPTFWEDVMGTRRNELGEGRLVAGFRFKEQWNNAEMHPAGDEIVYALTGAIDLVLQ